jgi:hypothetical protein
MQVTKETSVYEGWFKQSSFHGPARRIVMKKFKTFRQQVHLLIGCGLQGNLKPVSAVLCAVNCQYQNQTQTIFLERLETIYDVKCHVPLRVLPVKF